MKNSEANARRWLRQAERDMDFALLALREGFYAHACFMAHQVAEKALKALAYLRGDRVVLGHSVAELLRDLEATYPLLRSLPESAVALDRYYLPTRYPDALPGGVPAESFHQQDAEAALDTARRVLEAARSLVGPD